MLTDRREAYELLASLGAPDRLIRHARFVSEAADQLLVDFQSLGVTCDASVVQLGAVLHDIGKIHHPKELSEPGSMHERAGEAILLKQGVQPKIARVCVAHGNWDSPGITFEERVVALADKLWKGKREAALELNMIDEVAAKLSSSRWDVFERLDSAFEEIAAGGAMRLQESRFQ